MSFQKKIGVDRYLSLNIILFGTFSILSGFKWELLASPEGYFPVIDYKVDRAPQRIFLSQGFLVQIEFVVSTSAKLC